MELCKVQFRKSRLEIEYEKVTTVAKAKAEEKKKSLPRREGAYIRKCRHCDLDIIFQKDSKDKLIVADARHFFTPTYEDEIWTRHHCTAIVNLGTFTDRD
jgi:hypothetical protein